MTERREQKEHENETEYTHLYRIEQPLTLLHNKEDKEEEVEVDNMHCRTITVESNYYLQNDWLRDFCHSHFVGSS